MISTSRTTASKFAAHEGTFRLIASPGNISWAPPGKKSLQVPTLPVNAIAGTQQRNVQIFQPAHRRENIERPRRINRRRAECAVAAQAASERGVKAVEQEGLVVIHLHQ